MLCLFIPFLLTELIVYADFKALISKPSMPKFLCGVLASLILIEGLLGFRSFFSTDISSGLEPSSAAKQPTAPVPVPREMILKIAIFGNYMPENLAEIEARKSTLHLKLMGIILSPNENESAAILQLQSNEEKIFHVGDTVPGGAVIKRINIDDLYMMRNGEVEYLYLPEKPLSFDPPAQPLGFER
jgi:general secretion pathway protein C